MKKVCFLIGNLSNSGGTERVTTLISNVLAQKNFQVSILSLTDGKQPFFELKHDIKIYSLYPQKISFKKNFLGTVWRIRKFVTQQQIDTLIVVDSIACIFTIPALLGLRVKHISWEHFNFNNNNGVKFRDLSRKLAAKYCDYVITLTEKDKISWQNDLKNINAQVIAISNPCPFPIIQNYTTEKNTKIVLAVGRLTHVKGFDMLLEAWLHVHEFMPEWKLKIVGEGEDRQKLTNFIYNNNLISSVELVGNTSNVKNYYEQAEILCLSSRFEGFPMVLLEAQAFGLPVVAFDCETGPAEILADTDSILVPQNNINLFASSLIDLMKNEEKRKLINFKSKEKAKIYQPRSIIEQWIKLLDSL